MNVLEHYIVDVLEKRNLTETEIKEFIENGLNPDNMIFVRWKSNCYGSISVHEDYLIESKWEQIEKQGYDLR